MQNEYFQLKPILAGYNQFIPIYTAGWSLLILAGRNIHPGSRADFLKF